MCPAQVAIPGSVNRLDKTGDESPAYVLCDYNPTKSSVSQHLFGT